MKKSLASLLKTYKYKKDFEVSDRVVPNVKGIHEKENYYSILFQKLKVL